MAERVGQPRTGVPVISPAYWDWDDLARVTLAGLAVILCGVLLAFLGGWLAIHMLFEVLTRPWTP